MPTFDLPPGFFETNPGGLYALPDDGFQTVDPASVAILNPSSTNWGNIAGAVASFGTTLANVINSLKNNTPLGANAQPPGVTAKPLVSQTALPWLLVGGTLIAAFLIFGFRK